MKASFFLFHRFFTAIAGLFVGGVIGMLVLYFVMVVSGSDFGLDNVRPGAIFGAVIGLLFGLRFPGRWSWLDLLP